MTDNPQINIYENKIENRVKFKIKTGYYLKLLMSETMKLLGITKNKINNDKTCENMLHLKFFEIALTHFNIINNDNQHALRVLQTFIPNKSFGQLLDISPKTKNFFIFNFFFLLQNFHILKSGLLIKILNC